MFKPMRLFPAVFVAASMSMAACGGGHDKNAGTASANSPITPNTTTTSAGTTTEPHHSKLAGAAVGAAAGHMLGGHAVAGAAVGALVQHERNKHARR